MIASGECEKENERHAFVGRAREMIRYEKFAYREMAKQESETILVEISVGFFLKFGKATKQELLSIVGEGGGKRPHSKIFCLYKDQKLIYSPKKVLL